MRNAKIAANFGNNLRLVSGLGPQLMVYCCGNQSAGHNLLRQQQQRKAIGAARHRAQ
jgi:hypothetical protein